MAKTKISEFSTTPGNNTDINGINIAEGCAPSGINNAIRELMSDLKEWQSGAMDVYVIPQGTIASPGLQLYGDLDTGFYGDAANQLGVAVGGSSVGYFSASGWVGNVVAQTIDLVNIEVTNIKAKDGTASIALADSTGVATFSKPTVMSVDDASDALRITQIGAGNALLVEDSANPDTSPFVVTAAGLVGVGTLNPTRTIHVSAASGLPGITLESTSNGSSSNGVVVFNRTTTSTLTSQTIGSALWSHNLTDSTLVTAASIIVTGNNTAGSNTANMAIDAKTSTIMKVNGTEVANFASGGLNVTGTVDVTSIETTNIKAKDGTAAASIADSTGAITVTKDLTANGVTLGKGLGSVLTNTALGRSALAANTVGDLNTAVGNLSLTSNTGGTGNTAVGHVAMTSHQGGSLNTAVGAGSLTANLNGNNNTAIGQSALGTATGSNNTAVGSGAGSLITNGNKNTIIGNYTGNQGGLDIRTASNYIVLSDGDGNPRAYWNGANATFGGTLTATTITGTQVNSDNLRLDGNTLSSTDTNGNIVVAPNGTGITTFNNYLKTGNLEVGQAALGTNLIKATNTNGGIYLQTNGTGLIFADAASIIAGNASATTKITTNGASDLVLDTNDGSNSGSITIQDGVNGNILIAPNGTGQVQLSGALDVTNLEVTNIKAKDGTAALSIADSTGAVTVATALTANGGAVFNENGADVDFRVEGDTDANLIFADASTDRVGIGTSSPSQKLDVLGTIAVRASTSGANQTVNVLRALNSDNSAYANAEYYANSHRWAYAGSTEGMRLTSGGQVNIGGNFTSTNNTLQVTGNAAIGYTTAAPTTGLIVAGNVGIGTDSVVTLKSAKTLQVYGNAKLGNANDRGLLSLGDVFSIDANVGVWRGAAGAYGSAGNYLCLGGYDGITFTTGNSDISTQTERMRLDSSGNLGLGVTPSVWNANNKSVIQLQNTSNIFTRSTGLFATSNFVYNSADDGKFQADGYGVVYQQNQTTGAHVWLNTANNTSGAGATASAISAMTLDASGNLGVGATNPASFGKFVVRNSDVRYFSVATSGVPLARYDDNGAPSFVLQNSGITGADHGYGIEARLGSSAANTGVAGYIRFITEGVWGSTAASQDAAIVFGTTVDGATAERARITSGGVAVFRNGPVGAGQTAAVKGVQIYFDETNNAGYIYSTQSGVANYPLYILGTEVYVGGTTDNGAYNFQCNGTGVWGAGAYVNGSDAKLKDNIQTLNDGLAVVEQLRPVTFQYKPEHSKDQSVQPGFIAQELQQAMSGKPYLDGVVQSGPEYLSVAYQNLIPILTKAIQEQQAMINELKAEVAALKGV